MVCCVLALAVEAFVELDTELCVLVERDVLWLEGGVDETTEDTSWFEVVVDGWRLEDGVGCSLLVEDIWLVETVELTELKEVVMIAVLDGVLLT